MQFNQNPDEATDNEGFMSATYQAGIQVEKKKALKVAREASKEGPAPGKKDDKPKNEKSGDRPSKKKPEQRSEKAREWWGARNHWASKEEVLKGVPQKDQEAYF